MRLGMDASSPKEEEVYRLVRPQLDREEFLSLMTSGVSGNSRVSSLGAAAGSQEDDMERRAT